MVRTEKSSFYLPSLILSFFFQTRKKKKMQIYLFGTMCISSFQFFDKTNITLNIKYWLLILKQFTCVSLYSIALSRD